MSEDQQTDGYEQIRSTPAGGVRVQQASLDELKSALMVLLDDPQIQQKVVALLRRQLRLNPQLLR
jgi:hypothetical protein